MLLLRWRQHWRYSRYRDGRYDSRYDRDRITVIVDTIGTANATGVMSVIVTVPISPEISTTINCNYRPDRTRGSSEIRPAF